MNGRRGLTLIEVIAAMSAGSVLLVLAMGMIQKTMRAGSDARQQARIERTAARLSRQFREDVHQAESISLVSAESMQLKFIAENAVTYRVDGSTLVREQQLPQAATRREEFAFPARHLIRVDRLANPARAVLIVQHETGLVGVEPQVRLQVEAVVGRLLGLSGTGEELP